MHILQGFKVSTMKLWAVEDWNSLKQITIFLQSSQLETYFKIFENKIQLTFSFLWYSQITLYMWYFWILTKAQMTFAFFLPTSTSLCGAQVGMNIRTYLHCIYCKVKTRTKEKNVILLDQDVHVCGYVYGGQPNSTMLLETYLSCYMEILLQEIMGYLSFFSFFRQASKYPLSSISQTLVHFCLALSLFYE